MGRFSLSHEELTRLVGHYEAPRVKVGEELQCEIRGMVVVRGWHDAPIMWPLTWEPNKRPGLIVTGDLIGALETESVEAVRANWAVGRSTVQRWKAALKIGTTPRSKEIRGEMLGSMARDEFANERRRESITPERLVNLHAHPRGFTDEQRREISERMTSRLLALPVCSVCRQRRTQAHCEEHRRGANQRST